ncbi:DMT family transporter [Nostoc sp. CENA67]|uniref:DMT family transporter n=1 Tax=Amazonocrinis nigriterrae CENA67 TaxID=2794033 RepID=A0A8J7HU78_9NOST|nr:DMT family transporter [Amazonocrinis nigriterrae]MBH8562544.1 DMT family transporter [Amazonocrinis nigriterrae CENA67]
MMTITKIYIKLILVAFIWGGTFIAGRIAAPYLSPYTGAALRFTFASICLLWLVSKTHSWVAPSPKIWLQTILMGLTGVVVYNLCFFEGLKHISASRAALVIATNPVCALLAARIFLGEHLTLRRIVGILISLCGAVIVITQGDLALLWNGGIGIGEVIIFGCVLSWVTYTLLSKKAMQTLSPLTATTYSTLIGCTFLIVFAISKGGIQEIATIPINAWVALAFLGILGTAVAFNWYLDGVRELGAAGAALFINLVPVFAVLLAVSILGESLNLTTLVGGGLVIGGISLTNQIKEPKLL